MVKTIQEGDKTIVYMIFKENITMAEAKDLIIQATPLIREAGRKVYTITEINMNTPDSQILDLLQEFSKNNGDFVEAGALVGVTGIIKALVNAILGITGRHLKLCNSFEEAKTYVLSN